MIVHPHGSVLFCDDIRQEITGKLILIGVYQNDLIFEGPAPSRLGVLWCHIKYYEEFPKEDLPPMEIVISRRSDGGEVEVLASLPLPEKARDAVSNNDDSADPLEDSMHLFHSAATIPIGPLEFDRPARIRAIMKRGDDEILLGSLMILQRSVISGRDSE